MTVKFGFELKGLGNVDDYFFYGKCFKVFNLFRLLENELMEKFSMKGRNKNKHKFSGSRVCETVVGSNISQIMRSKIKILAIRYILRYF